MDSRATVLRLANAVGAMFPYIYAVPCNPVLDFVLSIDGSVYIREAEVTVIRTGPDGRGVAERVNGFIVEEVMFGLSSDPSICNMVTHSVHEYANTAVIAAFEHVIHMDIRERLAAEVSAIEVEEREGVQKPADTV